ncbi:MAG: outer membrane lipoprotein LolB [Comamonadaceae bacterium]|nr:MAG: outer membrane lipoprotein LolB [Comamonadaceae bacterium]
MTRRLLALGLAAVMAGCAQPPRAPVQEAGAMASAQWAGRLALQIESDPPQYSSGAFELKGNAAAGELGLFTPLGGTVAVMAWSPGHATLRTANGETRNFESLDALVTQATGTAVPVTALFDWLAGTDTPVPGWQADLSQLPGGRLSARRSAPQPPVQLRVILDK